MPDVINEYPLRENAAESLRTHSGRRLGEITAEAVAAGELSGEDLRTHADTLRRQAEIARAMAVTRSWPPICCGRRN